MWANIHADRSPWATSGTAGRLQEDVVPRPLWQELPGPSGHKLRLLEPGGHIHGDRNPSFLRTQGDVLGGRGATSTQPDADFLRTPGVDFGKMGMRPCGQKTPSLVRACGEA